MQPIDVWGMLQNACLKAAAINWTWAIFQQQRNAWKTPTGPPVVTRSKKEELSSYETTGAMNKSQTIVPE